MSPWRVLHSPWAKWSRVWNPGLKLGMAVQCLPIASSPTWETVVEEPHLQGPQAGWSLPQSQALIRWPDGSAMEVGGEGSSTNLGTLQLSRQQSQY